MQRQRIILIIGIILTLATVFMIKLYMDQERQKIVAAARIKMEEAQKQQVSVLVAKKDIPVGAVVEPDSLEVRLVPNQFVQPQAVTSLDRIAGMVSIAPIPRGEQITLSKLVYPQQQRGGLAALTPVGKRAITISVDNIASLAGMIKAGDYVDVIVMIPTPMISPDGKQVAQIATVPLFQNVLVLAVGQETGAPAKTSRYKEEERVGVSPYITLALSPQEANLIAFVQEQGKIRLILRSPADANIEPIQPVSWDTFFQYVLPKPSPESLEATKDITYVEVYRGLKKEEVPVYK